jgi:general secretion pathway protein B
MSYILDALKKIEQKRDREDPLRKPTFSGELPPERKKRARWPYVLLAALLLNAGVIAFLVSSPKPDKGSTAAQGPLLKQSAPKAATEDKGRVQETLKDQKEGPLKKEVPPPAAHVIEKGAKESALPALTKPPATEGTPAEQKRVPEKAAAPATDRVFSLSELPPAIRSVLPAFKVSGHAYSPDPQNRVTRVNDKILQEGQELALGLRVEEITPDGIIFSCQGYRFRVGTNENR